jgi:biopolymer transport protein ExbD
MAINLGSSENEGINEINITPFVDIVLVLLIIFMISTPAMVYRGMKISLPKTVHGEDLSHVTLHITVKDDGDIFLDQRKVSVEELKAAVEKVKNAGASTDAIISADEKVTHGKVMEISDSLQGLGILEVGFATKAGKGKK